jgi:hypothetical protein
MTLHSGMGDAAVMLDGRRSPFRPVARPDRAMRPSRMWARRQLADELFAATSTRCEQLLKENPMNAFLRIIAGYLAVACLTGGVSS